jgi:tetratricopeptide (TPR) repeat protein
MQQAVMTPAPMDGPTQAALPNLRPVASLPSGDEVPTDPGLLAKLGNIYYNARQYLEAIGHYERALKSQPADTFVRTDLGTAYWYNGDADAAITQFNKALSYDPSKADTLFNLGIVEWQGKGMVRAPWLLGKSCLIQIPAMPTKIQLIAQAQNNLMAKHC